jgi:methionine-rich copper-binding protein CopC
MMKFKPTLFMFSAMICLVMASSSLAHTKVESASLEDGGVYQTVPETFDLVFAQDVGLAALELKNEQGDVVSLEYKKPSSMQGTFKVPLPRLTKGAYSLSWRAISKDGHVLKGKVNFTVSP